MKYFKSHYPERMVPMRTKINEMLGKIPNPVLLALLLIIGTVDGSVMAKANLTEASITHGFTTSLFVTLFTCYSINILCTMFDKLVHGTFKNNMINLEYCKLLDRVLHSKMSDIQTISTGKVFDAVKDIASIKANQLIRVCWTIPTIVPFITLIVKEMVADWRMAAISISSIIVSVILMLLNDKVFHWNSEAKKKKAAMQGITVDNFMNAKTIKYLGRHRFAMNRLVKSQNDARWLMINPMQILYFRLIDIICVAPLLINIFISKDDPDMIAFIILSNYTLNNMREHLLDITEMHIELKAQESILVNLKGDDNEELPEISDTLELSNIMFDYGKDTDKFYIDKLSFKKGERTLVYGESGEGKSSLANLIAGGIRPTSGNIQYYKSYYIWQETESLDDTLWNNIVFENKDNISHDEVIELFESLNMSKWFFKLNSGFETQIGERGCKLSSGQKQRINIIRLVLMMRYHPEMVFIIDEITSNLDAETRQLAINLIDRECKSTLICISHNEGFDKIVDHQILVKNHKFIIQN